MVKKWRSCLSLLVSFAFILLMLYSDTLEVNASVNQGMNATINISSDLAFGVEYQTGTHGYISSGSISNGTGYTSSGQISSTSTYYRDSGTYHFVIPFSVYTSWAGGDYEANRQVRWAAHLTSFTNSNNCSVSNIALYDRNHTLLGSITPWANTQFNYDLEKNVRSATGQVCFIGTLEFDCTIYQYISSDHENVSFTFNFEYVVNNPPSSEVSGALEVNDSSANQSLDNIEQAENSINDSVSNPSGGGILGTIKNFFGGFFDWLHDTILGLFVPSSDYFTTWFTNVNNLLSAKLGMLYAPLDLLISSLNAVYSASSDFSGVPFPEIRWGDTVLVSAQNLTFSNLLGEHFEDFQGYVYFGTDVVLLFAFLMLLQRKITLVLRGHESG